MLHVPQFGYRRVNDLSPQPYVLLLFLTHRAQGISICLHGGDGFINQDSG
jgi:hypothetical protein